MKECVNLHLYICHYIVDELRGRTSQWPTLLKKKNNNHKKPVFSQPALGPQSEPFLCCLSEAGSIFVFLPA